MPAAPTAPPPAASAAFRDHEAPWCPELVRLPPGEFLMGAADGEAGAGPDERPRHPVRVARLALGRAAVTFEEYDAFCADAGLVPPDDRGWGRGRQPVIDVSWEDAERYCRWLGDRAGRAYRLPSEAEWEYACRAGTRTPFSLGPTVAPARVNYDGSRPYGGTPRGLERGRPVPVTSLPANPWGLAELHGNVWEWCADDRHGTYDGAPADGAAWIEAPRTAERVLRGGAWNAPAARARSAARRFAHAAERDAATGFRVARDA